MELEYKHFINQPVFKKIIIINIVIFLLPLVSNTFLFLFNLKQINIIQFFDLHPNFDKIITRLKIEKKLSLDQLDIDGQLIDKINKFAPIKHILKNKLINEHEIIELIDDISRDLNNYDLEFRIQELESKFSQDLSETTFNELKELKKKQNIN